MFKINIASNICHITVEETQIVLEIKTLKLNNK